MTHTQLPRRLVEFYDEEYLEKEIARMYDRLAKSGRDTAVISEKLTKLKSSHKKHRS